MSRTLTGWSFWGTRGSRGTEAPARQPGTRVNPLQRAGPIRVRAEIPSVTRKRAFLNHADVWFTHCGDRLARHTPSRHALPSHLSSSRRPIPSWWGSMPPDLLLLAESGRASRRRYLGHPAAGTGRPRLRSPGHHRRFRLGAPRTGARRPCLRSPAAVMFFMPCTMSALARYLENRAYEAIDARPSSSESKPLPSGVAGRSNSGHEAIVRTAGRGQGDRVG